MGPPGPTGCPKRIMLGLALSPVVVTSSWQAGKAGQARGDKQGFAEAEDAAAAGR